MADKPILFSAPMIRALLDGRKTQTRRAVKIKDHLADHTFTGELVDYYGNGRLGMVVDGSTLVQPVPYAPGDRLWVREAHSLDGEGVEYRCDYEELQKQYGYGVPPRWRPSIHMPRWASRLTLTVTDVRVQRLQEISEADAKAEGIGHSYTLLHADNWQDYRQPSGAWLSDPQDSFRTLWNSINGPDAWDANPWVRALTFDVHRCNIDQMEDAA